MHPQNQPPRAEAGVVIGGYELVRRLGKGGMAEVWVARRSLGTKGTKFVGIKLIADHYVGDERYARMFRSEAELAAILSHANIVQVFDEGEEDGRSYLIMEWVDGLNLLKLGAVLALIDDEERRFRITSYIIGQLLYALGYAHSITSFDGSPLGVVHRDVSPQNVLVSNHGEVKLTDFGVAYYNVEESSGIHVKGKVRYMSPEQLGGKTRSATVDLYAVGALLHELIDGKKFRGDYDDGQDLFAAILSGEVPPLSRPIPPELDELRLRLLAPDPADRIQTAEEAIAWLQRYPGYGDARPELTKLCSSLTGVVKPRAGPGQSSQVPMADRRTTQFKGKPGLAKPRVNPEPNRPALAVAPAVPVSAAGMQSRASSPTALRIPPKAATPPVITGETEFVRPQQPGSIGKKQGFPARAQNPALAQAPDELFAVEEAASPVPQSVIDQRSNPIPIHGHSEGRSVPTLPPTERLRSTSSSRSTSAPAVTDVIDASMIIEESSGSASEHARIRAVAFREGTDTSREIHPQHIQPSSSISIVVRKRSAIAMLVVGLLLVAVSSVGVTWWIVTSNKSAPVAVSDAVGPSAEVGSESKETPSKAAVVPQAEVVPSPSPDPPAPPPKEDVRGALEPPEGQAEESAKGLGPAEGQADAGGVPEAAGKPAEEPSREPNDSADGAEATVDGASTGTPSTPTTEPPKKKATVVLSALPSIDGAQVRIGGSKPYTIPKGKTVPAKVPAGNKKLEWRIVGKSDWASAPALRLEPGAQVKLQITFTGPRKL